MKSNNSIELFNITVIFRQPNEQLGTFREYLIRYLQGRVKNRKFCALDNVSLLVPRGTVHGVIGNNGAGKSTMLKVISRVLKPTQGHVIVYGKVAPLLELGAGFHPELTGKENIFLNGALLGYSRNEMNKLVDEIVEFSELKDFIDVPLRTYSSGMQARLGFAVATAINPDILIVDEILGVGDENFKKKCADRIDSFRKNGTTIFLVSHDMKAIETMCQEVTWLDHGRLMMTAEPDQVISAFRNRQ